MQKTYDYIVEIKRPNYQLFDYVSQLLIFMTIAVIGFNFFSNQNVVGATKPWKELIFATLGILFLLSWWIFCVKQTKRGVIAYYRLAVIVAAFIWFWLLGNILMALLFLIAAMLEKPLKVPPEIAFDTNEIALNSFPRKSYPWNVIQNIVLKDGIITIDFKNNKLIQKEVDASVSKETELEFNTFCTEQIRNNDAEVLNN